MNRAERIREIFADAADLSPENRRHFIDQACGADHSLRDEVLELLRFDLPSTAADLALGEQATRLDGAAPERVAADAPPTPETVGRYAVERVLGEGGMGIVYLANDAALSRKVAIKHLKGVPSASARLRLMREAQAMARIKHPNVAHVYEVGMDHSGLFIAMEYVEGMPLSQWLTEPRSTAEVLEIFLQAGRGLAAAHEAAVVHRDFKPQNVMVGVDGRVRVLDFGLAREVVDVDQPNPSAAPGSALAAELTQAGTMMGTPGYMSPEHFVGDVSAASDQWSFGAALYQALHRTRPFPHSELLALKDAVLHGAPAPPPPSDVSLEIERALTKALSRHPEERYSSMAELLEVIEDVVARDPEQDGTRFARQRRAAIIIVAVLVTLNLLGAGLRTNFRYDLSMPGVLFQSAIGILFLAGAFLFYRKTAFGTRHNRKLLGLFALLLATMSLHRLYGLEKGLDVLDVLRLDAMSACGLLTFGAVALERWLIRGAMVFALYLLLSMLWPAVGVVAFGLAQFAVTFLSIVSWPSGERRPPGATTRVTTGSVSVRSR